MSPSEHKDFVAHEPDSIMPSLMTWSVKVQTRPAGAWDIAMALLVLPGIAALANGLYEDHFALPGHAEKSVLFSSIFGVVWLLIVGYMWLMVVRRKTVHHYGIHPRNGWRLQLLAVPQHGGLILDLLRTGVPLLSLVLVLGNPPLAWLLAPPVAAILLGPRSWLGLDIDTHTQISAPWSSYQQVLIDRQNNRVVASHSDLGDGFEAHLPEHLLDSYLNTLRSLLPDNALFVHNR
jgi:hypothetical protein